MSNKDLQAEPIIKKQDGKSLKNRLILYINQDLY